LALLLHGVLESQENSLFKGGLRHDFAKHLIFFSHVLASDSGDPLHKGLTFGPMGSFGADAFHEILLDAPVLAEVSPTAEVVAQF